KTWIPHEQNILFYHEVVTKISLFALQKVHEQLLKTMSANFDNSLSSCTSALNSTIGLPCAHMIKEYLASSQLLNLYDFYQQ
ncbi:30343_t:CDS:1, partial [Gigaspora margarita]